MSAAPAGASGLRGGLESGVIAKGLIVYMGHRRYPIADRIEAVGAEEVLGKLPD